MDTAGTEGISGLLACAGLLVPLLLVLGLVLWGRAVARRRGTAPWRVAAGLLVGGLLVQLVGLLGTVLGLLHAFDAVSGAPPESKAAQLSAGIAQAMWATALGLGASLPLYLGCVIAFAYGTWASVQEDRTKS